MKTKIRAVGIAFAVAFVLLGSYIMFITQAQGPAPSRLYEGNVQLIKLKSRNFSPAPGIDPALGSLVETERRMDERVHVLLQFEAIPDQNERARLAASGVRLLAYIPENAWLASLPIAGLQEQLFEGTSLRWIGPVLSDDKIAPRVREQGVGSWASRPDGFVVLDVSFYDDVSQEEASKVIARHGGQVVGDRSDFHHYLGRFTGSSIVKRLAEEDVVMWIDSAPPPKTVHNDGARSITNVDTIQQQTGLDGSGVVLGIWDGGPVASHIDFAGRLSVVDVGAPDYHATHVAGTMAGDGSNSANQGGTPLQWRGVATAASMVSYDFQGDTVAEHEGAINGYNIDLSQNSWGYRIEKILGNCDLFGDYDATSRDYDALATGIYTKPMLILFAAGNARDDFDCDQSHVFPYTTYYSNIGGPGATAKNVVAVGATNSNDDSMTTFSDWGPVDDGRIKPDVVAPGCESTGEGYIHSTLPGDTYGGPGWCGTSMATPMVSGISALLIQQYRSSFGADPLPSSVKALLIHTAADMSDGSSYYNPGPDYASGYGRVDAEAAVGTVVARHIQEGQIANGITDTYTAVVTSRVTPLKVTLVWDDVEATPLADPTLVNNLDLELVEPDGTTVHRPWVLDPSNPSNPATTGVDNLNNVEQVYVADPITGTWSVRVKGTAVPMGPQRYSLATSASVSATLAELTLSPVSLSSSQIPNMQITQTLTLSNTGQGDLVWNIDEAPAGIANGSTLASADQSRVLERSGPAQSRANPDDTSGVAASIVADGGFEAGTPNPFWNEASTNFGTPICDSGCFNPPSPHGPHAGDFWAWFGGISGFPEIGSLDQDVTIPLGAAARLSFWLRIPAAQTTGSMTVTIDSTAVFTATEADAGTFSNYTQVNVDVSPWTDGGSHHLMFSGTTHAGAGPLSFFVDDVRIDLAEACDVPTDIPWLSVSPTNGTALPGTQTHVNVVIDSTGLASNDVLSATLCVRSNDLTKPLLEVPVALRVTEGAGVYLPLLLK